MAEATVAKRGARRCRLRRRSRPSPRRSATRPRRRPRARSDGLASPDSRRFSVYRNNVAVGLIGALEARYPVARRIVGADVFRALARALRYARKPRSPVMIAYGDDFPDFLAEAGAALDLPYLADVARLENAWVEAYHAEDATAAAIGDLAALLRLSSARSAGRISSRRAASPLRDARGLDLGRPSGRRRTAPASSAGRARTRSSRAPRPTSRSTSCRRADTLSRRACTRARRSPRRRKPCRIRTNSEPISSASSRRAQSLDHSRRPVMSIDAASEPRARDLQSHSPASPWRSFGLVPASLALLVLRLTLAMPFYKSGLTRWDGWFTLSFGAKALFSDEYRLHLFGQEIPFPQPELVAAMASTAEIVLPILLAFGFLTRYAALGLLCMTAVIQLVYPDGWQNFHLPWATMALAIMAFGPGRDLDRPAARPRRRAAPARSGMTDLRQNLRFLRY